MRRRKNAFHPAGPTAQAVEDAAEGNALLRGLNILREFRYGDQALSLAEITRRSGLRKATVVKLVTTLEQEGFLVRLTGTETYQPGLACAELGHAWLESATIARVARPAMRELSSRYGMNVVLATPEHLDMICIECCSHLITSPTPALPGLSVPTTSTAIGRAWLWAQPRTVQGHVIEQTKVRRGESGSQSIPGLYRAFEELEQHGYCYSAGEWQRHIIAVGTPVMLRNGASFGLCGEVSAPGLLERYTRDELGHGLVQAARQIEFEAETSWISRTPVP